MATLSLHNIRSSDLYPLVILERALSGTRRRALYKQATLVSLLFFIVAIGLRSTATGNKLLGLSLLTGAIALTTFCLELFFRSLYFRKRNISFSEQADNTWSLEVLMIVERAERNDTVRPFFVSEAGKTITARLGITRNALNTFLHERGNVPVVFNAPDFTGTWRTFGAFAEDLYTSDKALAAFLAQQSITKELFRGAATWYVDDRARALEALQWWTKERLGAIRGIGADWQYGKTYLLSNYATPVSPREATDTATLTLLSRMSATLSKSKESNLLLVGVYDTHTILKEFQSFLSSESTPETLRGKKLILLDGNLLIAKTGDKATLEQTLRLVLSEARAAGNVIFVIEHLSSFIASAHTIGTDVPSVLDPFLADTSMPIIATASIKGYRSILSSEDAFARRFDTLEMKDADPSALASLLTRDATLLESQHGVFFTYPAVYEAVRAADRYFSGNNTTDTATDILAEAAARAASSSDRVIGPALILALVSEKTDIPTCVIEEKEKDTLINLESKLKEHVVGQTDALVAIARAIRRARAGVGAASKPVGSFLFFGPTGVGKTETAKALARIMFGGERALMRLDMSEYQTGDALSRLIGFSNGESGILANMIRETPYGVLLLDEFEKTNKDVHDLFLQILDEGYFTDVRGERVNARNILFIATSNAGSDTIWKLTEEGKDLAHERDKFVASIIASGIFRPEFLNRFTDLILFHPLTPDELRAIAGIMLHSLSERLRIEKNLTVSFGDDMIAHVAQNGYDPGFGARPMRRFIEEHVEQYVADGIIKGTITQGATITLTPAMLGEATSEHTMLSAQQMSPTLTQPAVTPSPDTVPTPNAHPMGDIPTIQPTI